MSSGLDHELSIRTFDEGREICCIHGSDCSDYHYIRPILRRIGAVTSPFTNYDFYNTGIASAVSGSGDRNVLVSGTADYAWCLQESPLLQALEGSTGHNTITVVDICETPLRFSKLALERSIAGKHDLRTIRLDSRNDESRIARQDLITTDAFLTQFANPEDRVRVLDNWRKILGAGGLAMTTVQVAGKEKVDSKKFEKNVKKLFESSDYRGFLNIGSDEFLSMFRLCARSLGSRLYRSENEIVKDINIAGLRVVDIVSLPTYSATSELVHDYRGLILQRPK